MDPACYAVVMAGGSGTRFWPASRKRRPKQLLPLAKEGGSLLARTVERLTALVPLERILVVTAEILAEATARELPGLPVENLLAEPAPRNTAPCIGWAARTIAARDPNARLAVLPSDHYVADVPGFQRVLGDALALAARHELVTVGLRPTRPETGFGYIQLGETLPAGSGDPQGFRVARFVEKPNLEKATEYVSSGRFLWNSGMFFFRAGAMLSAIDRHLPELGDGLRKLDASPLAQVFPKLPSISIDYGVVEKIATEGSVAVVAGDFGWSDVGSWESTWELAEQDERGNAVPPGSVVIDASRNLVRTTGNKTVALIGVDDLVVVETEDAVLVMPRRRAQDVRSVVEELNRRGRTELV